MNNEEAKIHLQSAKLMLLGADGQPVSDLYYAVEKGIKALDQADILQEIRQEIIDKSYGIFIESDWDYTDKLLYLDDILEIIDKHLDKLK